MRSIPRTCGSEHRPTILSQLASELPSFTKMSSKSSPARAEVTRATTTSSLSSALYTGITTETAAPEVSEAAAIRGLSIRAVPASAREYHPAAVDGNEILEFWTMQAIEHGTSHRASWSDHRVIELEIAAIGSRLPMGIDVLDVGCANGYSSIRYAVERSVQLTG